MIGNIVSQTAYKVCEGKVIDFIGSGYSYDPKVVPMGWLSSIAGVTGVEIEMEEPCPIPGKLKKDIGLKEAEEITRLIKKNLSNYWKCFAI